MKLNTRLDLSGKHAFLSPSNYHWINYDDQKLQAKFSSAKAATRGTELHYLAHEAIRLKVKIANSDKTLSAYVRDGISYDMSVEQPLFYSDNCFGTADCLSFRRKQLRIHDLKTGIGKTSEHQLEVYASLFCLEYGISPLDIEIELRIYQSGEIRIFTPNPDFLMHITDKIMTFDRQIESMKEA